MNNQRLEPEKITIIEGPPPTFEPALDHWVIGQTEGPGLAYTVRCVLRAANGPALVERCRNAWEDGRDVVLEYRTYDGLNEEALILVARHEETDEGDVLQLWLRLDELPEAFVQQFFGDSEDDEDDDDPFDLG